AEVRLAEHAEARARLARLGPRPGPRLGVRGGCEQRDEQERTQRSSPAGHCRALFDRHVSFPPLTPRLRRCGRRSLALFVPICDVASAFTTKRTNSSTPRFRPSEPSARLSASPQPAVISIQAKAPASAFGSPVCCRT